MRIYTAFGISIILLGMTLSAAINSGQQYASFISHTVSLPEIVQSSTDASTVNRPLISHDTDTKFLAPPKNNYPLFLQLKELFEPNRMPIFQRLVSASLYTRCGEVEKNTSILYGLLLPLDVDDNIDTGQNGNDIRARFYLIPTLEQQNIGWVLGLSLVIDVERLGDEIAHEDIEIALDFSLNLADYGYGTHTFRLGLASQGGKELPQRESITFTVYPYLMYERSPDFVLEHTPVFSEMPSDLDIIAQYSSNYGSDMFSHKVTLSFKPAIQATMHFTPDVDLKGLALSFSRTATASTVLSIDYDGETNGERMSINFAIDALPQSMSFSLGYDLNGEGGSLFYDASAEFDVTLTIEMERAELMGCLLISQLPTYLAANWKYQILEGFLDVNTSSSDTMFTICDDLVNPSILFQVSNITNSIHLSWGIDQEGFMIADADHAGPQVYFHWLVDSLWLQSTAEMNTEYLSIAWNLAEEGYVAIDTDDNWVASLTFNFSVGENIGLNIGASFLKTEDFVVEWAVWPPRFEINGDIQLVGDFFLSIMLGSVWYPLILS